MKRFIKICALIGVMASLVYCDDNTQYVEENKQQGEEVQDIGENVALPPTIAVEPAMAVGLWGELSVEGPDCQLYCIYVSIDNRNDFDWFQTPTGKVLKETTDELGRKMQQQVENERIFNELSWYTSYYYSPIEKLTITANTTIKGIKAGEDLAELFNILVYGFVFSMDGELIEKTEYREFATYDIDSWTEKDYMCPSNFILQPKEEFYFLTPEVANSAEFSLSLTLKNGVSCSTERVLMDIN